MSKHAVDYTVDELMVARLSRCWTNESHVVNGAVSYLPVASIMLAKLTHAPELTWLAGAIGFDARPDRLTGDTLDFGLWSAAAGYMTPPEDIWSFILKKGTVFDTFCVRGAQIDAFGNCNNSAIGDYRRPKVRLPGAAGLGDIGSLDRKIVIWSTTHTPRTFVERVDFRTFAGWMDGGDSRRRAGLGGGPELVVTNLAVMDFEPTSKRMRLRSVHPGVTVQQVQAATGFDLILPQAVPMTEPPTVEQVRLLREKVDPDGIRLREFGQ